VVDEATRRFGRLDVLVNNAAIGVGKPLVETSLAEWNRVLAVNLTGPFLMARAAVRQMMTQEIRNEARGRIVNISSQHGMIAAPEDIAYGTSKSGVVYMTRQIAADYARHGIICNAVAPGKILTGKTGRAVEERWLEYSRNRTPWPRFGRPDDVASAALFLASDEANFITGENLLVDGGWMAS
jgi:NAD(P)-dependent dehydrogenase (short-subunit alcohol dehydrogenase family)